MFLNDVITPSRCIAHSTLRLTGRLDPATTLMDQTRCLQQKELKEASTANIHSRVISDTL